MNGNSYSWMDKHLHFTIRQDFGSECVKLVRNFENIARKIADHRNHLRFSLRCLHTRVIPNSIKIRSPIQGYRARTILECAERKLLNERIRQINFKIEFLRSSYREISLRLRDLLPFDLFRRVELFTSRCQFQQHEQSKARQIKKYELLTAKLRRGNVEETGSGTQCDSRWVKNLMN